jgi:hypothetical protein
MAVEYDQKSSTICGTKMETKKIDGKGKHFFLR